MYIMGLPESTSSYQRVRNTCATLHHSTFTCRRADLQRFMTFIAAELPSKLREGERARAPLAEGFVSGVYLYTGCRLSSCRETTEPALE